MRSAHPRKELARETRQHGRRAARPTRPTSRRGFAAALLSLQTISDAGWIVDDPATFGATRLRKPDKLAYRQAVMSRCDQLTIEDMLARVPTGASELFPRRNMQDGDERFLSVHQNWDYKPGRMEWHNRLSFEENPWFGSRTVARQPIFSLRPPRVSFRGPAKNIVDFYSTGTHAFLLSARLMALFDRLDPGTMDRIAITIKARSGASVPFYMAMPDRIIAAVDPDRTNVLIRDENVAGEWMRSITFPDGAVFRDGELAGFHHFTDLDLSGWFWSRELIDAARAAGIKGFRTISCATTSGFTVDRL